METKRPKIATLSTLSKTNSNDSVVSKPLEDILCIEENFTKNILQETKLQEQIVNKAALIQ